MTPCAHEIALKNKSTTHVTKEKFNFVVNKYIILNFISNKCAIADSLLSVVTLEDAKEHESTKLKNNYKTFWRVRIANSEIAPSSFTVTFV